MAGEERKLEQHTAGKIKIILIRMGEEVIGWNRILKR